MFDCPVCDGECVEYDTNINLKDGVAKMEFICDSCGATVYVTGELVIVPPPTVIEATDTNDLVAKLQRRGFIVVLTPTTPPVKKHVCSCKENAGSCCEEVDNDLSAKE